MRKIALVLLLWIGSGLEAIDAAYIVKLKNGNEYVTERYWQEGTQLLFDTYGGVFGIDKKFVAKIEKSRQSRPIASMKDQDPPEDAQPNPDTQTKESADSKLDPEKKRDGKDPIVGEYNRLRDKAKEVDGLLTTEILELLKEITAFRNKLTRDSKLFIEYGREFNDAHEFGDRVESTLRSRTQ